MNRQNNNAFEPKIGVIGGEGYLGSTLTRLALQLGIDVSPLPKKVFNLSQPTTYTSILRAC